MRLSKFRQDRSIHERVITKYNISSIFQYGGRPPSWNSHLVTWLSLCFKFTSVNQISSKLVHAFALQIDAHNCLFNARLLCIVFMYFSQPSIYIDGWLYGMRMTSVTFRCCLKTIPHIIILSPRHESDIPSLPGRQVSSS